MMNKAIVACLCLSSVVTSFAEVIIDSRIDLESLAGNATVYARGELHLSSTSPLNDGVAVDLAEPGASVVFEGLRRSEVRESVLASVTVQGRPFDPAKDRIAIYGTGTAIIAEGEGNPLTIYSAGSRMGVSMVCDCDRYYRGGDLVGDDTSLPNESLGDFDNAIRSFVLRKGYSATFATNPDGTGYSRNFVASDGDIVFDEMPAGLEFTSFIRVCRFDWIGKRGWAGTGDTASGQTDQTRSAWYYTWGAHHDSGDNYEFVPMRHNKWWDSWSNIDSRTDVSCLLGFNEPDHKDQADMTVDEAIKQWPELLKSGLRLGSPAPDNIKKDWLIDFLAAADSLHYRVDFVATHMYMASQDPDALCTRIGNLCRNIYGGRPMWITEWNNGAPWTNEKWPDKKGPRRDADFNIILDENGNETETNCPHTEGNSAQQCEWLARALVAFDECPWLERHAIFNFKGHDEGRSAMIEGKLTPAGRFFSEFYSRPGYNSGCNREHTFSPGAPLLLGLDANSDRVRLTFLDTNGETAAGYVVERCINKGEWVQIGYLQGGYDAAGDADYKYGDEITFFDRDMAGGYTDYRVKAISYRDPEETSGWSRRYGVKVEAGLSDVKVEEFKVYGSNGNLMIESDTEGTAEIYRADGTLVRTVSYGTDDATVVDGLGRGLYIVKGKKVIL